MSIPDKKCEMFGCNKAGVQYFNMAPGTNVFVCQECHKNLTREKENETKDVPQS